MRRLLLALRGGGGAKSFLGVLLLRALYWADVSSTICVSVVNV